MLMPTTEEKLFANGWVKDASFFPSHTMNPRLLKELGYFVIGAMLFFIYWGLLIVILGNSANVIIAAYVFAALTALFCRRHQYKTSAEAYDGMKGTTPYDGYHYFHSAHYVFRGFLTFTGAALLAWAILSAFHTVMVVLT